MSEETKADTVPSIDDFFSRLTPKLWDTKDVDGFQIPGLEGLMFKPLDAARSMEVESWGREKSREEMPYMTFILALTTPKGDQFLTAEHMPRVKESFAGVIARALRKIRYISGMPDEEDQKKTLSRET